MATIRKRNKNYEISVSCGYDLTGRQIRRTMTYKPEPNMTEKQIEKEVHRQAVLFEEKCQSGQVLSGNIRFADFADMWFENRRGNLRPRTLARYKSMMPRINTAIGHLRLDRIKPMHLEAFYKNLAESGVRLDTKYNCKISLDDYLKEHKLTTAELCRQSGISNTTVISIRKGKNVNADNAQKLATALNMPIDKLFEAVNSDKPLSGETIRHHHTLISSILSTAVKWGVIFSNPCERTEPPRVAHKDPKYLDEVQATTLLELLDTEDINPTYRTLIKFILFIGLRRGEALGLKWSDIDFDKSTVNICRSLQYTPDRGVFEDETKNKSSMRTIKLPASIATLLRAHRVKQTEQHLLAGDRWNNTADFVFTTEVGEPLRPDSVSSWFSKFISSHPDKLPYITLHSLRHTNATLQIAGGVPITTVAKRLGHTDSTTTGKIYAHAIKSADEAAAETLDNLLTPTANRSVG